MTRTPSLLAAAVLTLALAACGDDDDSTDRSPASAPAVDVTEGSETSEASETGSPAVGCAPAPAAGAVDPGAERTMYASASASFVVTRTDGTATCLSADGLSSDAILGSYLDPDEPEVSLTIGDAEAGVVLTYTPDAFPDAPGAVDAGDYFFAVQAEGDYFPIYSGCDLTLTGLTTSATMVEFTCGAAEGTGEGPFAGAAIEPAATGIASVTGWLTAGA